MSALLRFVETPLAHAIGWTLLHSIWEGAAIAAIVAAMLFAIRSPRARYGVACAAMAAMAAAFAVTLVALLPAAPQHFAAMRIALPSPVTGAAAAPAPKGFEWRAWLGMIAPWLAPIWATGVFAFCLERMTGWFALWRMSRRGVCYASEEWHQRVAELSERMGVVRAVRLLESCLAEVPMVVGHARPVILMPVGILMGLPAEQIETILLHELAHVRRSDYMVNLCQRFAEGLLFYHPAVWWFSSLMRVERENCCDDLVVALSDNGRAYALALAALERNRSAVREAAVAASGGSLVERIRRLVAPKAETGNWSGVWAPVLAAVIAIALATASLQAKQPQMNAAQPTEQLAPRTAAPQAGAQAAIYNPAGDRMVGIFPERLKPASQEPISLRMTSDCRNVYQTIANLGAVDVEFAQPFAACPISLVVSGVTIEQALDTTAKLSGTAWRATSETKILVTEGDLAEMVVKTVPTSSSLTPEQINAVVSQIRATFGDAVQVMAANGSIVLVGKSGEPARGAITLRGSPNDVALAEKLVANITGAANATAAQTSSAASAWPDGPGKAEFLKNCSTCHAPDNSRSYTLNQDGWTAEMNKMKQLGMQISDPDAQAVLNYLTTNFGPKDAYDRKYEQLASKYVQLLTALPSAMSSPERPDQVYVVEDQATQTGGGSVTIQARIIGPYGKWLDEDVVYIITPQERDTFLKLGTNEERDSFIEAFWQRRNPNPDSPDNAYKTEHYRRIAYANERFAANLPGWQTDRGRVYIVYGPPDERTVHSPGGNGMFANEVWRYNHIEGIGDNLALEFVDRDGHGEFTLAPATVNAR